MTQTSSPHSLQIVPQRFVVTELRHDQDGETCTTAYLHAGGYADAASARIALDVLEWSQDRHVQAVLADRPTHAPMISVWTVLDADAWTTVHRPHPPQEA